MDCNPATGKKCSEAAPDDAPYCSIVKVLVPESREWSFALIFPFERNGQGLSGVMSKVCKQQEQEHGGL